jgi:hypothetical protein
LFDTNTCLLHAMCCCSIHAFKSPAEIFLICRIEHYSYNSSVDNVQRDSGPVLEVDGKRGKLAAYKNERYWKDEIDCRFFFGQYET